MRKVKPENNPKQYEVLCNEKLPLVKKVIKIFKEVKSNAAKLSKLKRFNNVAKYTSNDIFGEIALTLKQPRAASIAATRHTYCLTISKKDFDQTLLRQ